MQRVSVVGTTGSGKTTVGRELATRLGVPFVELDALNWGPGWLPAGAAVFKGRVERAIAGGSWVVDGNYGGAGVRDVVWARADTLVWLDYALWRILLQLFRRTTRRVVAREELWSGNRESFRNAFLSRNSLFLWALKTYRRRRLLYPAMLALPEHRHLRVLRFRSPRETRRWLEAIEVSPPTRGGSPLRSRR